MIGILAIAFVWVILVVGALLMSVAQGLVPSSQGRTIGVAASTLVLFALFQPIRQRVQRIVDRRFDRARYDAERTVAAFGARLRDEVDLANLNAVVRQVVAATVAPVTVGIWTRQPDARS